MITGIKACADGGMLYELTCGTIQSNHYEAEISEEKNLILA
jgi:hypothetical protein